MRIQSHERTALFVAGLLTTQLAFLPQVAAAEECTGTDARELVDGCNVLTSNADFRMELHVPPLARPSLDTEEGVKVALNRAVIFLHGYGVTTPRLPSVFYEDGSAGGLDDLHRKGISVVAMAPGNAKEDKVEDDAEAVRRALSLLNAYRGEDKLPWVVLAHSMGALMTRIALVRMEEAGTEHDVALYISYDSPHSGVHVPLGMQNLKLKLDEWAAMTKEDFMAIDRGWEGVFRLGDMVGMSTSLDPNAIGGFPDPTSLQAQQMTIHGLALPEAYPAFMALLDETGFPEVRSIAVTNGNTQGVGNTQEVSPGGELFYFTGGKGNSAASVRGTFEVFTDAPGLMNFKSHVKYFGVLRNHEGGRKDARTPAEIVLRDSVSGGTLDYAGQMLAAAHAARGDFHNPSYRAAANSAIPFVPTTSALALPLDTPDAELAGIVAAGGTPFDEVFAIGDLANFASNIDHNTLVLPDALLAEIHTLLPCREGIDVIGCVEGNENDGGVEEEVNDGGVEEERDAGVEHEEPVECADFEQPTDDGGCEPWQDPYPADGGSELLCSCRASTFSGASALWLILLALAARRRSKSPQPVS